MNPVGTALVAALVLAACAATAGLMVPAGRRARIGGILVCLSGCAGVIAGVGALAGQAWWVHLPELLPLAGIRLGADALSGWFLLLVGAVTAIVGVYTIGY